MREIHNNKGIKNEKERQTERKEERKKGGKEENKFAQHTHY